MRKLFLIFIVPIFIFSQDNASFQLEIGGRWDHLRLIGSGKNIIATQDDLTLIGPVNLIGLKRKLEDINLFHVGGIIQFLVYNVIFLRGFVNYGFFFSDPREVFQGALQDPTGASFLFLENKNSLENKQFSLDLIGHVGFLSQVTKDIKLGFTAGYGYYLLRMDDTNRVETNGLLGTALFYYRINQFWRFNLEIEGLFLGFYDQIITFSPQQPQSGNPVTIEAGRLKTNRIWGYGGLFGVSWLFGPRWALTLAYRLRTILTPTVKLDSFGGKAHLKTFWSTQKASLILSYSY